MVIYAFVGDFMIPLIM
jgi:hypothetical protein